MYLNLSSTQEAIMAALCYGDIFRFPLSLSEFSIYMPLREVSPETLAKDLDELIAKKWVHRDQNYYTLAGNEALIPARLKRTAILAEKWDLVRRELPFLLAHRWIKGVLLTGSLAAKNPDGRADADLLLVLEGKRMWIGYLWIRLWCRLRKKGLFCPNYVMAESELELSFPNFFTAVEYAMAVPLKWSEAWPAMEAANPWLKSYLPNCQNFAARQDTLPTRRTWFTRAIDLVLMSPFGWLLNKLEWRRLRHKTKGLYMPSPRVYKPHSPKRQWEVFKKLKECLDQNKIEFKQFRAHIESEITILDVAGNDWQDQSQKDTERSSPKPAVAKVCSRNAN